MANVYADLGALKAAGALNVPDGAYDARLLALLEAASRWIDGYCGRDFAATAGERRFDGGISNTGIGNGSNGNGGNGGISNTGGGNGNGGNGGGDVLFVPDLVSVGRLRTRAWGGGGDGWVDWPADAYLLYPADGAPTRPGGRPYTRIAAAGGGGWRFPAGRGVVSISGVWGYGSVREDTGLRIGAGAGLTADAVTITATPASTAVSGGHTIRIDGEDFYVVAAVTDKTADTTTLTVLRGVNGSTAAAHDAGVGIAAYRYPAAVSESCLRLAMAWWRERGNAPFAPAGGIGADADGDDGIDAGARALLAPLRRRLATLGV